MAGDQDVWARNALILKKLYQDDRKTLKEVKSIMEEQHGFPRIPISAYETNLRHRQGLQKRLKAKDWPRIYHYARANGFDKFDVLLNGTVIPWIKAWKEIRRSGVTRSSLPIDHLTTLPDKVELRRLEEPVHRSRLRDRTVQALAPRIDASPLLSPQDDEVQIYMRRVNSPNSPICPSSMPSGLVSMSLPHSLSQDIPISSDGPNYTTSSTNITTWGSSQEVSEMQSVMLRHQAMIDKLSIDQLRYIFSRVNLETIPWNEYRLSLYAMRNGGNSVPIEYQQRNGQFLALIPADGFFGPVPNGLQVLLSETRYPMASDLADMVLTRKTLAARFDPYHFLAQVVYIFSNNNIPYLGKDFFSQLLDTLVKKVPRRLVFSVFRSNSLSIRAVWERLFQKAFSDNISSGMGFLIEIPLRFHSDWIEQEKNKVLYAAVSAGDTSLVRALLDRGASTAYCKSGTMFALAACNQDKDCAKLLVENCRPNDLVIGNDRSHRWWIAFDTVFSRFLSEMGEEYAGKINDCHYDYSSDGLDILKMVLEGMLQSGADVDASFPRTSNAKEDFYHDCNVPLSFKPTYLDVCFYLQTEIFVQVLPYSRKHNVHLTRDGVCTAALQSKEALSTYLDSLSTTSNIDSQAYLRATLIDQFSYFDTFPTHYLRRLNGVGGRIAQALIEYGVLLTPNPGLGVLQEFLLRVVESAARFGLSDSLAFLTAHLIGQGAVVSSAILAKCLEEGNTTVLNLLIHSGAEVAQFGQEALRAAAVAGNNEAVCLLLTIGVDINAVVDYRGPEGSMTVLASLLVYPTIKFVETRRSMWQFFIRNGAKLRLCPQDTTCYRLLEEIMQFDLWNRSAFNFILQFEEEVNQIAPSQWADLFLLSLERAAQLSIKKSSSAAHRITEIADVLLRRCGGRVSQPVLAVAIKAGCQQRLINDLIKSGQSIQEPSGGMTPLQAASNEHDYELVSTLLHLGVDINAPACSEYGADALQFACKWRYSSNSRVEQMRLQSRLVKLLLAKGADVNGPANDKNRYSATALQLLCGWECLNREEADYQRNIVTFLLESGANANAAPGPYAKTALQRSAQRGDLETTSLLIQYGADPNGHPLPASRPYLAPYSALDSSAENGRLDMTQYLLNIGALSASPGASGFEGAMDRARANGHHAVREIILKHVEKISQQHRGNLIMQQAHEESIQRHAAALKERQAKYKECINRHLLS